MWCHSSECLAYPCTSDGLIFNISKKHSSSRMWHLLPYRQEDRRFSSGFIQLRFPRSFYCISSLKPLGLAKSVLWPDGCQHKNKANMVFLLHPAFLFILLVSLENITSDVYPIAAPSTGIHANICFKIIERLPTRLLCDKNWMNPQCHLRTLHDFWARSSVSSF